MRELTGEERLRRSLRRFARVRDQSIIDRLTLFAVLMTRFSTDELQTLMFALNLSADQLPHATQAELARSLIQHCEQHGTYLQLVHLARTQRPDAFSRHP